MISRGPFQVLKFCFIYFSIQPRGQQHLPRSSSPFYKTQGAPFTPRADEDHPTTTHFRHPRKTQLSTPHLLAPAHLHLTSQGVHAHKSPPSPSGDPELPATGIRVTVRLPYRKTFVFLCIYPQSKFTPYAKEGLPRGGDGTTRCCANG